MLLGCMGLRAQNVLLSQEFRFTAESDIPADFALHKDYLSNKFKNWTFTDYCYAIKNNYLQVGTGSGFQGSVTTPVIPFNGSAKVIIRFKQVQSNAAKYDIKKPDGNHLSADVPKDGKSYSVSFTIDEWTPSSQITISNISSSYYITNVDVYDISTPFFYEPFNGMTSDNHVEFGFHAQSNFYADINSCDNIDATLTSTVWQTEGAIYINSDNSYTTPVLSGNYGNKALLTFRVANKGDNQSNYTVNCSGSGVLLKSLTYQNTNPLTNSCYHSIVGEASKNWITDKIVITGLNSSSQLSFSGKNFFLDEILLRPLPDAMGDNIDNSAFIDANDGVTCDLTLTRALTKDIWNTLCLPFDVTKAAFGEGAELRTLTSSKGGEFVFNSVNSVEEIPAGTPFLVKVTSNVENPTFTGVTVKNVEPQPVGDDSNYKFCGTYSPVNLNIDGTHVFLDTEGNFRKPTVTGNRMKGLRAYFIVPKPTNNEQTEVRVSILDEPSAIHSVEADVMVNTGYYDLTGRRHDEQHLTRGLYVRNGKKFFVK